MFNKFIPFAHAQSIYEVPVDFYKKQGVSVLLIDLDNTLDSYRLLTPTERAVKLIASLKETGLKVIIDFVPNHVARQYHSICAPEGVKDLGEEDNPQNGFDPQNNFYYCPGQRFTPYLDLYHGEPEPYIEEPAQVTIVSIMPQA